MAESKNTGTAKAVHPTVVAANHWASVTGAVVLLQVAALCLYLDEVLTAAGAWLLVNVVMAVYVIYLLLKKLPGNLAPNSLILCVPAYVFLYRCIVEANTWQQTVSFFIRP